MDNHARAPYYLLFALLLVLGLPAGSSADRYDELFEAVFHFGNTPMSIAEIKNAMDHLYAWIQQAPNASTSTGLYSKDPRKVEIAFWKNAAEPDMSRCNYADFRILEAQFQRSKYMSEKLRASRTPNQRGNRVLNLEIYYQEILQEWVQLCSQQMPLIYYKLQQATMNNFEDVIALTSSIWHTVRMSPYEIGRRVGDLLLVKATDEEVTLMGRSVDDLALVKRVYDRYTPCVPILRVVHEHKGFFELLMKSKHFQLKDYVYPSIKSSDGQDDMKKWVDRISVCSFIEETGHVIELAADTMIQRERMVRAIFDDSNNNDRGLFNNERYNRIFRYSATPMSFLQVKSTLAILNFRKTGLRPQDDRRNAVCFWLQAATHHTSKCNNDDDEIIRLNLEYDKARADEAELTEPPFERGNLFNLESFVQEVRMQRLRYCEFSIGLFFVNRVEKWRNANKKGFDLRALTEGLIYSQPMVPEILGKRVADMIIRRSHHQGNYERIGSSLNDVNWIVRQYRRLTPCHGLMLIAERYERFYRLATAPGLYEHTKPSLRHWLDKITVCRSIEEQADQVFMAAAAYLSPHGQI